MRRLRRIFPYSTTEQESGHGREEGKKNPYAHIGLRDRSDAADLGGAESLHGNQHRHLSILVSIKILKNKEM